MRAKRTATAGDYVVWVENAETLIGGAEIIDTDLCGDRAAVAVRKGDRVTVWLDNKMEGELIPFIRACFLMDEELHAGKTTSIVFWRQLTGEAWAAASA